MKAVILAGGFGTRLSEATHDRPKPMIEIGGKPLLWHVMKTYSRYGVDDFIICLGYKSQVIKEFFRNYYFHASDVTVDLHMDSVEIHDSSAEPWRVTLAETGLNSMTGGRVRRIARYLDDEPFCLTYGDGVSDVDIGKLIQCHKSSGLKATVTAVRPPGRFGVLDLAAGNDRVTSFTEKPHGEMGWINGGFFVLEPSVIDYIEGDDTVWEREPLERLASEGQLQAFRHEGFWQPCDTLRDMRGLEALAAQGVPPWLK